MHDGPKEPTGANKPRSSQSQQKAFRVLAEGWWSPNAAPKQPSLPPPFDALLPFIKTTQRLAYTGCVVIVIFVLLLAAGLAIGLVYASGHNPLATGNTAPSAQLKATSTPQSTSTATPSPTSTATPVRQTELRGLITITNQDKNMPFEGDVQIVSTDGKYQCQNPVEPNGAWPISLNPLETHSLQCSIPVSYPPSLPAHTFLRIVQGASGQEFAIVDNPDPFTGNEVAPTPTSPSGS